MIVRTTRLPTLSRLLAVAGSLGIGVTACGGHGSGCDNGTGSSDGGGLRDAHGGRRLVLLGRRVLIGELPIFVRTMEAGREH
jgi:hypothetical protein